MNQNPDIGELLRVTADFYLLCDHCASEIFVGEDYYHDREADVVICEKCEVKYSTKQLLGGKAMNTSFKI